jgi:glycine hydroxymethyltransferase
VIAIREAKAHGAAYAQQIVANAKAFGRALMDEGVQVEAEDFGFTESHQLAINVSNFGLGKDIARSLADNDIILNYNMLPGDTDARNPSGLRIGVQEMTRYGMKEDEMGELASLVKAVISGGSAKDEVNRLRSRFTEVLFV